MALYGIDDIRVFYQNDLRFLRQFDWGGWLSPGMKISLNWIRDYVALDAPVPEITRALTFLGFEVEQVAAAGAPPLENVVVGEVLTRDRHPNADKLSVCTVDIGPGGRREDDRLRRPELQGGRPRARGAPGRGPAGRPRDQAVEDPGPALRRHDVLGARARDRRGRGRPPHPGGPAAARRADQRRPRRRATPSSTSRSRRTARTACPTSGWPASSRLGSARTWSIPRSGSAARSTAPAEADLFYGVQVDAPEDCPLYSAHVVTGVRVGPEPRLDAGAAARRGPAPDQQRRRRGQLRDARDAGSRSTRSTRGKIARRPDRGAARERGRGDHDPRRQGAGPFGRARSSSPTPPRRWSSPASWAARTPASTSRRRRSSSSARSSGRRRSGGPRGRSGCRRTPPTGTSAASTPTRPSRRRGARSTSSWRRRAARSSAPCAWWGATCPGRGRSSFRPGFVRERLGFDIPAPEMRAALESLELNVAHEAPAPGRRRVDRVHPELARRRRPPDRPGGGDPARSTGPSGSRPRRSPRPASPRRTTPSSPSTGGSPRTWWATTSTSAST